ncbi:MAG: response regulator [Daejeonella sp.]|uniref:response regulator n=1 Tax=Daejeonella sp. JGW-45 TaxID=3034148 RepID=UPI0023EC212F|nr:response regulator [Daejeonella sp. JGW-45]
MDKRILICDDDEDILSICTYILEESGWNVHTRNHCKNIVETVEEIMPDIILMDNWIPDMGGIKATQAIKAAPALKHIPIIYFSANNDVKALARVAGADDFLAKPFDIEELEKIVAGVFNK